MKFAVFSLMQWPEDRSQADVCFLFDECTIVGDEAFCRDRIAELRSQMESEFGVLSRVLDSVIGPLLLWSARREGAAYPQGRPLEPRTFVERRNWA